MIGKIIGNYQITSALAHGGMGAVYRGRHLTLPREVVIKSILRTHLSQPQEEEFKARFRREAHIQSQLDHPNIVRVYDYFDSQEENYYLVMEYVAGMTLLNLLERRGPLDSTQALGLFKQALVAMDYAHNFRYVDEAGKPHTGLIHRDIKPANMLLDGQLGRLKITDFGIVKMAGERNLTKTGSAIGTLPHMSPEQIRGLELDARSDIYSLGITFYLMFARQFPFPLPETDSEYELLKALIERDPLSLTQARPDLPTELVQIVMRSLRKDPAERFQTAAEFLDAILDYERGVKTADQVADPSKQQRRRSTSTAPTVIDQTATTIPRAARPPAPTPIIVSADPLASAPLEPKKADGAERKRGWLKLAAALIVLSLAATGAYFWLPKSGNEADPELSRLLRRVYADGIKTAEEQLEIDQLARKDALDPQRLARQEQEMKDRLSQSASSLKQGMAYAGQQNYSQAAKEFQHSVEVDPENGFAWANLCGAQLTLGQNQEAQSACAHALAVDANNWLAHYNLGSLQAKNGASDQALHELSEALRLVAEDRTQRVTKAEVINQMRTDPTLGGLRRDARFTQLLAQK